MSVSQLGYLGLNVRDLQAWRDYANDVLGMCVSEAGDGDGSLYLRMDDYHHRLILTPSAEEGIAFLGWQVSNAEEFEKICARLRAADVEVTAGTREEAKLRKVARLYKFKDVNGIPSELFFGPLIFGEKPFEPTRPISGYRAGELGLGHVFMMAPDLEQTAKFYCDLLGFRISDFIDLSSQRPGMSDAVFLHCNPRHHTLAFGQGQSTAMRHLMLETKSLDDVGFTQDLAKAHGLLARTIGKHTNDQVLSFYMKTPSDFDIEYGWGGRLVNDDIWAVEQHVAASMWGHEAVRATAPVEKP